MDKNLWNEPHEQEKSSEKVFAPSVLRCGAKTRVQGLCQNPGMSNGRCRLHGGLSTGPRSKGGKEKSSMNAFKHGRYAESFLKFEKTFKNLIASN